MAVGWPLGRAGAVGCEAVEGGMLQEGSGKMRRGAHSRFAEISLLLLHLYDPSKQSSLKHEEAGTIVTCFATPCVAPPTVEATWVPCPSHPVPSAGRMPLTAWHEPHSSCSCACEEGWNPGGWGGVVARVVR